MRATYEDSLVTVCTLGGVHIQLPLLDSGLYEYKLLGYVDYQFQWQCSVRLQRGAPCQNIPSVSQRFVWH